MKTWVMVSLLLVILTFGGALHGESFPTNKGNWLVGGEASFISSSGDLYEFGGDGSTSITFMPFAGAFVTNGLSVGGMLSVQHASQGDFSTTVLGFGPELRYYFGSNRSGEGRGTVLPYLRGAFQYLSISGDLGDGSGTTVHFGGGFSYMLTNSVGLTGEAFLELDSAKEEDFDSESGTQFGLAFGLSSFITK